MTNTKHIESFSIITKEEKVRTLTHSIVNNTFAIEIITPLPGYYGAEYLISREKPGHILLITKDYVHFEDFFRIQNKINTYLDFNFDATFASVIARNTKYHAIRIKDVENFDQIEELQHAFMDEGIQMAKPKNINEMALIRIKKFLSLSSDGKGIYSDTGKSNYKYIEIEKPLTWKLFEKITQRIRHNSPNLKFDVALGVLFRTGNLMDVIRVYGENLSKEDMLSLHEKYVAIMKEY